MPVTLANSRIACSGTYTTLASIMTAFQAAGGAFTSSVNGSKTTYYAPAYGFELAANAIVGWNPEVEELVCSRTMLPATSQALVLGAGSRLTIGFEYVQNGKTLRTKGFGLRFDRPQTAGTSNTYGGVINLGASLVVYGNFQIAQTINNLGNYFVSDEIYGVAPSSSADPSIRLGPYSTMENYGTLGTAQGGRPIRIWSGTGAGAPNVTRTLKSKFENVVLQAQSGSTLPYGQVTFKGIRNATNSNTMLLERSATASDWANGLTQPFKLLNIDVGTGWSAGAGYGISWTAQEVAFSTIDAETGTALTFKAAVVGNNNGTINPYTLGGGSAGMQMGLDFTSSAYLMHLFAGTETKEVLLGVYYSAPTAVDRFFGYSKTGVKGQDVFPIKCVAYGYSGTSGDVSLPSDSLQTISLGLFKSTQVTEMSAAAVAAYTDADTVAKVTDLAHLWLYNNFDGTHITPSVTRSIDTADFGDMAVVIDKFAAAYVETATTVTIKADVFVGNIATTSTVTFLNGAEINGIYSDENGSSVTIELAGMPNKSATCLWDAETGEMLHYAYNTTGASQTYTIHFPTGSAGRKVYFARELYGYQREEQLITLTAGFTRITLVDLPDIAITEPSQAIVESYTSIGTPSKDYDRTAVFRLTEQGIQMGQIITRSGFALEHGGFSKIIRQNAPQVFSVSGNVITIKAASYDADSRYNMLIATPPATITAFGSELINIDIEDANGNSTATIKGTSGSLVDAWKVPTSTINADYATGTKIASNIGDGKFRFVSADGFKLVFYDKNSLLARDCSMSKGTYTLGWYIYNSETGGLTQQQSQDFVSVVAKVADIYNDVNSVTAGFVETTDGLHALRQAVDTKPTLTQIEGSAVLAKEATVAAIKAKTAALVNADLSGLATHADTQALTLQMGRPLQAGDYTAPDNATISQIAAKVATFENQDLSGVATGAQVVDVAQSVADVAATLDDLQGMI